MAEGQRVQVSEGGPVPGLPRPRLEGMPVPWITRVDQGVPAWANVNRTRLLSCQVEWLCQVCGQELPRRAWVVLEAGRVVLSDAALHMPCVVMAFRWCPYLIDSANELETVDVEYNSVHADGERLDVIADCGDVVRSWIVPLP